MSSWKLQCHFCGDTVSTGKLNRSYYKMHLEAVHNVQQHGDSLLQWMLSQQSVQENVGSTVSAVANIMGLKGISIQRSMDGGPSPKAPVPGPLLNIKGITVQRVDEQGGQRGPLTPNSAQQQAQRAASVSAAQMRQQEQAINRWANGCEHGCRICRKNGKNFTSFTKQGLLKHLETEHEVSERDYKEEFKCLNLITRASNTSCKECGTRIKRIPTSLNMHFKKHGLNIRTYWLKHLKPPNMPVINGSSGRGVPLSGRGSRPRGRGGMMRGMTRPGIHKCNMPNCTRSFDNVTALNLHRSWHGRGGGGGRGAPRGRGVPSMSPVVVLNRVDGEQPQDGSGEGEEMVMEMDPMDMLEVGIGEDDDERGEEVEVDLDNLEVVDDDGAPKFGEDEVPTFDDGEATGDPIEITPVDAGDESMNTPDMTDTTHEENENGGLNTPEPVDETEATQEPEAQSDAESDIELVASFTPKFADPRMPIPLPDQTNDPPGTHIPPMTPPPIQRLPSPEPNPEQLLQANPGLSITKITNQDVSVSSEKDLDLEADLGLGPDVEFDEDGAPIIHKKAEETPTTAEQPKAEEKPKINILDQIENEIQQKIKSQEAAKAAEKAKNVEDAKSPVKPVDEAKVFCEDSKQESPNPEGAEPQSKKIKLDNTPPPPQETNQPGTPLKPNNPVPTSLGSTNGFNPVDPPPNHFSPPFSHQIPPPAPLVLGPPTPHSIAQSHPPHIPYSTSSAVPPLSQPNIYQPHLQIPISHHDPTRMHPNQPYPYEPMPNREHYYPMQPPIPNQPPMMQPMQPNFYHPHQHQPQPPPPPPPQAPTFPNQKQSRFFPYTGYATPIHTFNDTVEPGPDGRLPLDYWNTMSCTVDIPNCPLNCCHVRAHQEIMEGSTNWKVPYGPPLNGVQPCSCCINS